MVLMKNDLPSLRSGFPPLLSLMYQLQQKSNELLTKEAGVSLSQAHIMSGLDRSAVRSQRHVAGLLGQTEANISRQLQAMKKQGLVSIAKNKKDKRSRDVKLTHKGQARYQKALSLLKKEAKNHKKLLAQTIA